jgi:hypothetical protein
MASQGLDSLREGDFVAIKTYHQLYISADPKGNVRGAQQVGEWERFQLIRKGKRKWAFRSCHSTYLSAFSKDNALFTADTPLRRESFLLTGSSLKEANLFSKFHAFYLSAQLRDSRLECNRTEAREWERFSIERQPTPRPS